MPTYKSKIIQEFIGRSAQEASARTFIIDNFDLERDGRMLRELSQSAIASRVILISTNREVAGVGLLDVLDRPFTPKRIYLWPMSRAEMRVATSLVFSTDDTVFVSNTVDKVYQDLLGLCIPLTPPSVIMYLRVLAKVTDFTPLNRVHIQNRFITESLSRSSDIYRGNFNAKNKIEIIAAFSFTLFTKRVSVFDSQMWFTFAKTHKAETLKEFDEVELFNEAQGAGIIGSVANKYFFRLSFFYTFFLGRYLASNRDELRKFLEGEEYLEVPAVIDVISGLEADNVLVLEKLCSEISVRLDQFAAKYLKASFDPLLSAVWADNDDEEKVWKKVNEAIEQGPQSVEEIDKVKTSILAEARTEDQNVTLKKFNELEHALFMLGTMLADALRNSDEAPAHLKLKSLELILRSELVAFQVGTMFADKLASQKVVNWGAVSYMDFNTDPSEETSAQQAIVNVIIELSLSVSSKISEQIGTYKLANVFRTAAKNRDTIDFIALANFACILEAKGPDWQKTLEAIILSTKRDAFYLWAMLTMLMHNLSLGLEKGRELENSKRLVALIHSKRANNKMAPGEKLISAHLRRLEKDGKFEFADEGAAS